MMGLHTFDYGGNHNPTGYALGAIDSSSQNADLPGFGQIGGKGAMLYDRRWYCLEFEIKLNDVRDGAGDVIGPIPSADVFDPTGNSNLGGFLPNGYMKFWLDGVLVWQRTSMCMRTLPMWYGFNTSWAASNADTGVTTDPGYITARMRPARDLGLKFLLFNWYHGGQTPNPIDREIFISQLAYGTQYIGPMRTNTPLWLETAGNPLNTWIEVPNSKMATDMVDFSIQYAQGLSTSATVTAQNTNDVYVTDPGWPLNPDTLG